MAGGVAGGFLGSMLFSSLGNAGSYGGGGYGSMGGAGGGGGMGLLDMVLLGGMLFLAFRWWKSRQLTQEYAQNNGGTLTHLQGNVYTPQLKSVGWSDREQPANAIGVEAASDIFFLVQGAWTRRDLSPVKNILGPEILSTFDEEIASLHSKKQTNRLENITIRQSEITESWNEGGTDFSTVSFRANLLDYTVNDSSGAIIDGSDSVPVKFQEDWTFAKATTADKWQLVRIDVI
jgi:hypothetical protein